MNFISEMGNDKWHLSAGLVAYKSDKWHQYVNRKMRGGKRIKSRERDELKNF